MRVDVGVHSDIKSMVEEVVGSWGRLDFLVNNAFNVLTAASGGAVDLDESEWDRDMAVLVKSVFLTAKYAIPEMKKTGGGSIVNVSSVHGILGAPGVLAWILFLSSCLSRKLVVPAVMMFRSPTVL